MTRLTRPAPLAPLELRRRAGLHAAPAGATPDPIAWIPGNRIERLAEGGVGLSQLLRAVRQARDHVHLAVIDDLAQPPPAGGSAWSFGGAPPPPALSPFRGEPGRWLVAALAEAGQAGRAVHVLLPAAWAQVERRRDPSPWPALALVAPSVRVGWRDPLSALPLPIERLLQRWIDPPEGEPIPRSVLIVDGRIAFFGEGAALPGEVASPLGWRVEGPAVQRLQRLFLSEWQRHAAPALSQARFFPPLPVSGAHSLALGGAAAPGPSRWRKWLARWRWGSRADPWAAWIDRARDRVVLWWPVPGGSVANPAALDGPSPAVVAGLLRAASRGVRSTVVLTGWGPGPEAVHDSPLAQRLQAGGVGLQWQTEGSPALVRCEVDGRWTALGRTAGTDAEGGIEWLIDARASGLSPPAPGPVSRDRSASDTREGLPAGCLARAATATDGPGQRARPGVPVALRAIDARVPRSSDRLG